MAEIIENCAPGGKRQDLVNLLPLRTPILFQVFPIYICNFRCEYCYMSIPRNNRSFYLQANVLPLATFTKAITEAKQFPDKIKTVRFVGMGEPLLHRDITLMIQATHESGVTDRIELLTNASLLTPKLSDSLIKSGLTRLMVSLQGITSESYKRISGINLDFAEIVSNVRYFYQHRDRCHVYVKVVDYALTQSDRSRFYEIFDPISDSMGIEHVVPIMPEVPYGSIPIEGSTQFGLPTPTINVCPQPFFHMQLNPDGAIVPCYQITPPDIMGNVNWDTLTNIWTNRIFTKFRYDMLSGRDTVGPVCKNCNFIKYRQFPEDNLDAHTIRLKEAYR